MWWVAAESVLSLRTLRMQARITGQCMLLWSCRWNGGLLVKACLDTCKHKANIWCSDEVNRARDRCASSISRWERSGGGLGILCSGHEQLLIDEKNSEPHINKGSRMRFEVKRLRFIFSNSTMHSYVHSSAEKWLIASKIKVLFT